MSMMLTDETTIKPWYSEVPRNPWLAKLTGVIIMMATIIGFGFWANTAPIAGAVISTGVFVTTGQNKTIQHLEGGVIRAILVREGDTVEPGQSLVQLDETAPRVELRRLALKQARLEAISSRLTAEARGETKFTIPTALLARANDPDIELLVRSQRVAFDARLSNMMSEIATHQKGIDALDEKIGGSQTQLKAVHRQTALLKEELDSKQTLLARGYIRKPEVLALQRNVANMQGEVGRITGDIGDARERIARGREQIDGVRKTSVKAAVEQLQEVGAELNDLRERMRSATGILERANIVAPVRGTVVKLRYNTSGGVIEPGKNIMEIVSLQDEIVIEARVRPQDIDKIKHSQTAVVRLTALNQRTTPMVNGTVFYISADALPDDKNRNMPNQSDFYVVRVRLDKNGVALIKGFEPTPGMPAEVYVQTAERTFFEYLMQPLRDSMTRAFRES
jgi:HlyD family type I secretion membrane fusion protein